MRNSTDDRPVKITVVIPNWNGMRWLKGCLESLSSQDYQGFDTLVIDNGSTDGSVQFIKENFPGIKVMCLDRNTGFANAVNIGIENSTTPYIALLNTDTQAYPDWLSSLLRKIESSPPEVAAINPQMLQMENPELIDDAGDELSWYGAATKRGNGEPAEDYGKEEEVFSPCAGASLYRRDFLSRAGGFDPAFFAYMEDVDLGLRGRLMGYRYLYLPKAKVLHESHGSGIQFARYVELITRNRLLLFTKNIPSSLLLRHVPELLYGQLYFFCAYARPLSSFKGYLSFLAALPAAIRQKRAMKKEFCIDKPEIDVMLSRSAPIPPVSRLVRGHITGALRKLMSKFSRR